jgi:sarcosine oxidase subunit beta
VITSSASSTRQVHDVIVIGAGVVGSSIAAAAATAGFRTVVVDRLRGAGMGSTSSSAGIIRVHAEDRESSVMADEALVAWNAWRDFAGVPSGEAAAEFTRCGTLILDAETAFAHQVCATMSDAGVAYEILTAGDVKATHPDLELGRFGGPRALDDPEFGSPAQGDITSAVHTPESGYVADPLLAARNLADRARAAGAEFRLGRSVVRVLRTGDRVDGVVLDDGSRLAAEVVVNAAGPASRVVNDLAHVGGDFCIGTVAVREELHHVPLPPDMHLAQHGVHIVDSDLGTNFRTDGAALLIGGNGAACDISDVLDDPDRFDESATRAAWERNVLRVAQRIPGLPVPRARQGLAGVYDQSEDWLPIYDRTDLQGYYVAMGTSGNQFKTAPVTGAMFVGMIQHQLDGHDQDTDAYQHVLEHSGRTIDTAAFSRLRDPRPTGGRG